MEHFKQVVVSSAFALLTGLVLACGGNVPNPPPPSLPLGPSSSCPPSGAADELIGGGSSFDAPLFAKQFDAYNSACHVKIDYQSIGSGGGVQQFSKNLLRFGATDAPMTDEQIKDAGGNILHIPVTLGAVSVGYNVPGLKPGLKLSGDVLAKMFLGQIKKWNDPAIKSLNPDTQLPDLEITTVHRSDGSGTSFIFTNYLSAVNAEWKTKVGAGTSPNWPTGAGGKGSEGASGIVKQTPGSIGYFEMDYAVKNNLAAANIQNAAGKFVVPSTDGATAAAANGTNMPEDLRGVLTNPPGDTTYPITGFSWIVVRQNQTDLKTGQLLVALLWWMVHDGQNGAKSLYYAPLPDVIVRADEQQLKKMSSNGKPLLLP